VRAAPADAPAVVPAVDPVAAPAVVAGEPVVVAGDPVVVPAVVAAAPEVPVVLDAALAPILALVNMNRSLPRLVVELVPGAVDPVVPVVAPPIESAAWRQPVTVIVSRAVCVPLVPGEAVVACAARPALHANASAATLPIQRFLIQASLFALRRRSRSNIRSTEVER
jgi:hypothetical protein